MNFRVLPDLISLNAAAAPNKECIFFKDNSYTYAQVEHKVASVASILKANGVKKGDRVLILLENSPEFVFAYFGIMKLGAVAVPSNVFLKDREIATNMNDCTAEYIITSGTFTERMTHIYELALNLKMIFTFDKVSFESVLLKDQPDAAMDNYSVSPDDLALVLYTSGTTGKPKGVMLLHRNVTENAKAFLTTIELKKDDRMLLLLPMFHATSMLCSLLAPLTAGASIIILESILEVSRSYYPDMLTKLKPSLIVGVPALFATLARAKVSPETKATFPFRLCICGGAPLPVEIIERFNEVYGKVILEGYGLSEASPVVSVNPLTKQKVGTIGVAIPGVDVKIVDANDNEVPRNTPGELITRGPNIMQGYWNQPEETEKALKKGWLHTGDIATQDEEGFLTIVDRLKDLILVKGMNVYPRELEELLYKFNGVLTAAVVGLSDGEGSEIPIAYIKVNPEAGVTQQALKEYLRYNLASYKVPRRIVITDDIPMNAGGKVLKKELRERAKKEFV